MTNPITPDTVRALLEAAQLDRPDVAVLLETWLPIADARERLRESMPHIITAYLDACAERDNANAILHAIAADLRAFPDRIQAAMTTPKTNHAEVIP